MSGEDERGGRDSSWIWVWGVGLEYALLVGGKGWRLACWVCGGRGLFLSLELSPPRDLCVVLHCIVLCCIVPWLIFVWGWSSFDLGLK